MGRPPSKSVWLGGGGLRSKRDKTEVVKNILHNGKKRKGNNKAIWGGGGEKQKKKTN